MEATRKNSVAAGLLVAWGIIVVVLVEPTTIAPAALTDKVNEPELALGLISKLPLIVVVAEAMV